MVQALIKHLAIALEYSELQRELVEEERLAAIGETAAGISEPVRRNLFRRYYSTKGSKGTGLGLMVVHKIVDEHHGAVEVESTEGAGSVFRVRLPVSGA